VRKRRGATFTVAGGSLGFSNDLPTPPRRRTGRRALTKFEESEIDKRKQLEVRVSAIEKHLGLDKKIAA
jgi:hypothetical protein